MVLMTEPKKDKLARGLRKCDGCKTIIASGWRVCPNCKHEFRKKKESKPKEKRIPSAFRDNNPDVG